MARVSPLLLKIYNIMRINLSGLRNLHNNSTHRRVTPDYFAWMRIFPPNRLDDQDRRAEEAERAEDAARADEFGDAFTELERQTSTVQADITSSTKRPQWEESEDEEDDDGDERDDEVRTKKSRLEGTTETLQRAETEDS
eukprot:GEMP01110104.1.p1 GENE.GEMP01110104.1~~GEMP01110104.1.p1  ORF type:complete len:140 (+),score=33.39 GEMP01110104.1:269-688(+)